MTRNIKHGKLYLESRNGEQNRIGALELVIEDTDPVELEAKIEKCTSLGNQDQHVLPYQKFKVVESRGNVCEYHYN